MSLPDAFNELVNDPNVPLCESVREALKPHRELWGRLTAGEVSDSIQSLIQLVEVLASAPPGYPDCTSAIIRAMDEPYGVNLLRVMHRNQELIAQQKREIERLKSDSLSASWISSSRCLDQ